MRALLAALLLAAGAAHAGPITEWFGHMQSPRQAALLLWQDARVPLAYWVGSGTGDATWVQPDGTPTGTEHWVVRNGFVMVDGFDQWGADCTRAELEDIATGAVTVLPCARGHYYVPFLLPSSPWRIRNWGLLAGTNRFYWEADFYPGESALNPCWYEGAQTRPVIREREVWWDIGGGWVRGSGTPPFDAQGHAQRPTVTKQYEVTLAQGLGVWTAVDLATGQRTCLYSVWRW
jgi:hypothetical protein